MTRNHSNKLQTRIKYLNKKGETLRRGSKQSSVLKGNSLSYIFWKAVAVTWEQRLKLAVCLQSVIDDPSSERTTAAHECSTNSSTLQRCCCGFMFTFNPQRKRSGGGGRKDNEINKKDQAHQISYCFSWCGPNTNCQFNEHHGRDESLLLDKQSGNVILILLRSYSVHNLGGEGGGGCTKARSQCGGPIIACFYCEP